MTEFDFKKIFSNTYGYQAPDKFKINNSAPAKAIGRTSSYYAKDMLGREMFLPVTFYGVAPGVGHFQYVVPFAVMSINCKKNNCQHTNAATWRKCT